MGQALDSGIQGARFMAHEAVPFGSQWISCHKPIIEISADVNGLGVWCPDPKGNATIKGNRAHSCSGCQTHVSGFRGVSFIDDSH
jgi:hypothetical protein